jgi:dolichol kinase
LLRREILRKSVHLASILVPPLSGILGKPLIISLLAFVSLLYALSEFLRVRKKSWMVSSSFSRIYYPLLREDEVSKGPAMAPLYLSLGVIICLTIFPEPIGYASIAIVSLGDGLGGLERILRGYGKNPSAIDRLRSSSLSFAAALMGASFFVSPLSAFFAVLLAAFLEAFSRCQTRKIDDNLAVPIASALFLQAFAFMDFEAQALNFLKEIDRAFYWFIAAHRIVAFNEVFRILDWLTILLLLPLIILHALNSGFKKTVPFLFLLAIAVSSAFMLKLVFKSPRPCNYYGGEGSIVQKGDYGFPSSHGAIAGLLFGYSIPYEGSRSRRLWWIRILKATIGFLIIFQSLYNGIHWLTDILAGLALGIFISKSIGSLLLEKGRSSS